LPIYSVVYHKSGERTNGEAKDTGLTDGVPIGLDLERRGTPGWARVGPILGKFGFSCRIHRVNPRNGMGGMVFLSAGRGPELRRKDVIERWLR